MFGSSATTAVATAELNAQIAITAYHVRIAVEHAARYSAVSRQAMSPESTLQSWPK